MAWPLEATKRLTHDDYTVAWICALPIEKTAARNMLDELHLTPSQPDYDRNIYTFGRIYEHNVVIVCQGEMGITNASVVATRMEVTFRKLRFGLLVGIAGGVPNEKDIRLGDVVISKGDSRFGGVVAHDHGKETPQGFEPRSFLAGVPELLRNTFSELESLLMDQDSKIMKYLSWAAARNPRFLAFQRPISLDDNLFEDDYPHVSLSDKTCAKCNKDRVILREPRNTPLVHFGIVASGNQVIKDSAKRGRILESHPGVIAVEMEAAGLMNVFGCATIRGICDYADSHKNDGWQMYASAVAAAVAKEVLSIVPPQMVVAAPAISMVESRFLPLSSHWNGAGGYQSTTVLLISYEEDDDCILINRDRLKRFFAESLGYNVRISQIPWDNAQLELKHQLRQFIWRNDLGSGHLMIIMYLERGSQPYAKQPIQSVSSRTLNGRDIPYDKTKSGSKDWIMPRALFNGVGADILEIIDCWSPGDISSQILSSSLGRHEILTRQDTPLPDYAVSGLDTFTLYFCLVLESLLDSNPSGFTTRTLHQQLNRTDKWLAEEVMPRQVTLHISPKGNGPITIAPQRNEPLQSKLNQSGNMFQKIF